MDYLPYALLPVGAERWPDHPPPPPPAGVPPAAPLPAAQPRTVPQLFFFFFLKKKTAGCGALSGKRDLMWAHEFRCDSAAPCCGGAVMCQVIQDFFSFLIWHFFAHLSRLCDRDQHPWVCCCRRPVCTYIVIVEAASRHVDRLRRGPIWVAEPVRGKKNSADAVE